MCVVIHIRGPYDCPVGNEIEKVCSTLVLWVRIGITHRKAQCRGRTCIILHKSCGGCLRTLPTERHNMNHIHTPGLCKEK